MSSGLCCRVLPPFVGLVLGCGAQTGTGTDSTRVHGAGGSLGCTNCADGSSSEHSPEAGGGNDPGLCAPAFVALEFSEAEIPCWDVELVYQLAVQRSFRQFDGANDADVLWPEIVEGVVSFLRAVADQPTAEQAWAGLELFPALHSTTCELGCSPAHPAAPVATSLDSLTASIRIVAPASDTALGTPLSCAVRSMLDECERLTERTAQYCAGILVTDGTATDCNTDLAEVSGWIVSALSNRVQVHVVALPTADTAGVAQLARAAGVDCDQGEHWACPLTSPGIDVASGLEKIRTNLTFIASGPTCTQVEPCTLRISGNFDELSGQVDPELIALRWLPASDRPKELLPAVASEAACGQAGGWHFDDPSDPERVRLCPNTCAAWAPTSQDRFDLQVGCPLPGG